MQTGRKPRWGGGLATRLSAVIALGIPALTAACEERDRLTFPNSDDGNGPVTMIDQPSAEDTTVSSGPGFFVYGRTIDADGVDTVYFLVSNSSFPPFRPDSPTDTVRFALPITTFGYAGDTILVQIHAVDLQGNHGPVSSREIVVQ